MSRLARVVLIALAIVGFDVLVAVLGVGFVTSQQNARDAIKAQRAQAESATKRISEYRLQQAQDHATIEALVASQDEQDRQRIAAAAAQASITQAQKRVPARRSTSTTQPSTTTTTRPPSTTTTATPPKPCAVPVDGVCLR
jgi:septal ring factor EnvC (AmiA/AmiB activator)